MKHFFAFVLLPFILFSCNIKTKGGADLAGDAGEILIVINDELLKIINEISLLEKSL